MTEPGFTLAHEGFIRCWRASATARARAELAERQAQAAIAAAGSEEVS